MQQSDYEIVGKFGFESRTDRIFQNAKLEKALIPLRIRAFFMCRSQI